MTMINNTTRKVNVETFERDIRKVASDQRWLAGSNATGEDIGRLSAEAVLAQYEEAAKSVEAMGNEIKDRIKRLEGAMIEADSDMKTVAEAAAAIREKGKLAQLMIEEASGVSKQIRETCAEFLKSTRAPNGVIPT